MNKFKKVLALVLALCMTLGCAACVSAASSPKTVNKTEYTKKKVTITVPAKTKNAKYTVKKKTVKSKSYTIKLKKACKATCSQKVYYKKIGGCTKAKVNATTGKITLSKKFYTHNGKTYTRHTIKIRAYTKTKTAKKCYKTTTKTTTKGKTTTKTTTKYYYTYKTTHKDFCVYVYAK